ncbi:MAG: hypothetical protein AB7D38_05440 [Sulfurimonas sp.]|jgi:hypothetical protein|uniref:hypothetical protein n=1 Tax=Sulfurimonas sp. TaxID=2022749 RepID=UPI003D0F40DF
MNLKKIWLLLLLSAITFSVTHDYAFAALGENHCSVNSCISETSVIDLNEEADTLCKIHVEYHAAYPFTQKLVYIPTIQKRDTLFKYNKTFLSLDYFNFFKPPIA